MGDMADYYLDLGLANGENPYYRPYRRYRQPRPQVTTPPPKCRTCGEVCYWAQKGGNWVLMDSGRPHKCSTAAIEAKSIEGFTDDTPIPPPNV